MTCGPTRLIQWCCSNQCQVSMATACINGRADGRTDELCLLVGRAGFIAVAQNRNCCVIISTMRRHVHVYVHDVHSMLCVDHVSGDWSSLLCRRDAPSPRMEPWYVDALRWTTSYLSKLRTYEHTIVVLSSVQLHTIYWQWSVLEHISKLAYRLTLERIL